MRLRTRIRVVALVVSIVAALPSTALGVSQTVVIQSFAFGPVNAVIAPGESITWRNADGPTHTATSDLAGVFDTGQIANGASKTVTFASAGTYAYHCSIHLSMKGTITVQGAATPVPPPPTPVPTRPPTPAPTAVPTAVPTASPTPVPSPSPSPSATASPTPTPSPSAPATRISLASASPAAARAPQPTVGGGPGPLVAAAVVALAAALAGLAIYLYRRR